MVARENGRHLFSVRRKRAENEILLNHVATKRQYKTNG